MKKPVVLSLAILMSLFAVTGSIAYFTDSITVQNEVQSGTLSIEQFEFERVSDQDGNITLQPFTQHQVIYPSFGTESHPEAATPYSFTTTDKEGKTYTGTLSAKLMGDSLHGFVDKIVAVKNTGTLNAFVRTYVAVPTAFLDGDTNAIHLDWNPDNWILADQPITATISEVPYTIYYATCSDALSPNDISSPSLLGFYINSQVSHNGTHYTLNGKNLGTSSELKILVASVASQVIPIGIGDDPRDNAVDSMKKTYPDETYHPWKN